ncbi:MAG: CpaF family protein [Lachnospiraceae bacterium]|nr:CpaF family protein [Lachnospiraceae bacterium]
MGDLGEESAVIEPEKTTRWEQEQAKKKSVLQEQIQQEILREMDREHFVSDEEIWDVIQMRVLKTGQEIYLSIEEKQELIRRIFNSLRKLDVLQEILEDEEITEIMVNGHEHIFVEKEGRLMRYPSQFSSRRKLEDVVQQIVGKMNRMVNEANPIVDVRLEDGSRVNAVLPPVALNGPILTIRKFPAEPITMDKLILIGSVTEVAAAFLQSLVRAGFNIFISGGTGSGKTTFLNALSNAIPKEERVITIEDSAELQIQGIENLVKLEARNANLEGKNAVTIRDLIKSALRMRPDRIILGEVRDAAACELLSAMNTGHDGSLSTGHAGSPGDMLNRLETLVLMGMDIPLEAVRSQIASAIDIVVQLGRLRDKSRRVLEVDEVLDVRDGRIRLNPIYTFQEKGEDESGRIMGQLIWSGNEIQNQGKLQLAGIAVDYREVGECS